MNNGPDKYDVIYKDYLSALLKAFKSDTLAKKLKALGEGLKKLGWDKIGIFTYSENLKTDEYFIIGFDPVKISGFDAFRMSPDGRRKVITQLTEKNTFFITWEDAAAMSASPIKDIKDVYEAVGYSRDEDPQGLLVPLRTDTSYTGSMHIVKSTKEDWNRDLDYIELYARFAAHIIEDYKLRQKIELNLTYHQKVFENSLDSMAILNNRGVVLETNQSFRNLFCVRNSDVKGKHFKELLLEYHDIFEKALAESLAGVKMEMESDVKINDEIRRIRISIKPQIIESMEPRIEIVATDITEESRLKQQVAEAEMRYKLLFDNAAEGIALITADGKFLSVNKATGDVLGYTAGELIGHNMKEFLDKSKVNTARRIIQRILNGRGFKNLKFNIRQKDGSMKFVSVSAAPYKSEQGKITGVVLIAMDHTSEHLAYKEKEQSQKEYQRILDSLQDIYYKCDAQDRILHLNPVAGEILNDSDYEKYIGKKFIDALCANKKSAQSALRNLQNRGRIKNSPLVIKRSDGETIFCEENSHLLYDEDNNVIGREGIIRDITHRRKIENALAESEEQYRTLTKNLPVGVYRTTIDKKGTSLYLNPAFLKIFGYESLEDMQQIDVRDLYYKPDERQILLEELRTKGFIKNAEFRMKKKNGELIWVSDSCITTRDSKGNILYLDGILVDITEEKRLKEELLDSEKRYRLLAENSQDIIWTLDLDLKYTYISPSVALLTGHEPEKVIGMHIRDRITPESWEKVDKLFREKLKLAKSEKSTESTLSSTFEIEVLRKDGEPVWVEVNAVLMKDDNDKPNSILGVTRDITERKKAEKQIAEQLVLLDEKVKERTKELAKANQELIRSNRVKSEFLANISHELRSPLTSIMGYTEIMNSQELDKEEYREYLDIIASQSNQLHRLVNSLLEISKLEAGSINLYLVRTKINDIVHLVEKHSNIKLKSEKLTLVKELDENLDFIYLDGQKIYQVVRNLVDNAIKFSSKGREIKIATKHNSDYQQIVISDEGIGIEKEKLKSIFEPFYQADSSSTRSYEGAGLGLHLVKNFVELHNGKIEVESEVGKGTKFTISLPTNLQPEEQVEESRHITRELPVLDLEVKKKILVVDDDDEISELISIVLKKEYDVEVAANGQLGVQKAKEVKPDLILMDLSMPVLDGYSATKQIKSMEETYDIPIIALSARAMKSEVDKALNAGCLDHMSKPFKINELQKKIKKYLED